MPGDVIGGGRQIGTRGFETLGLGTLRLGTRSVLALACLVIGSAACGEWRLMAQPPAGVAADPSPPPAPQEDAGAGRSGGLEERDGNDLSVRNFRPQSQLRAPRTPITRAKYPVIDIHTHFFHRLHDNAQALDDFVDAMDRNGIAMCVSLDGLIPDRAESHSRFLSERYPDRFAVMGNVDWIGDGVRDQPATWSCHRPGFADRTADEITRAHQNGWIVGIKVFKRFGLNYRNPDGSLVKVDDPRFDPIWERCGELGLPILIHTADPIAFFLPVDETNERWEELSRHPDWSFAGDEFPSRDELLAARNRLLARHPRTTFIAAHMSSVSEDLAQLSTWLDRYPNLMLDFASRISELGRQERTATEFLVRFQDRVLFGTDGPWPEKRLNAYWRFLETADESFDYSEKDPPPQGLWRIDGMQLPDRVLEKLYYRNALRLIPALTPRYDAARSPSVVPGSTP